MWKIFSILFISILAILLISPVIFAHKEENEKSYDQVIQDMMTEQKVGKISDIDCKKVSVLEFEDLGDVVMDKMVGNHELHEQMDVMMGGEGSESLRQMHVIMGKNWLGCSDGFGGMMQTNMMPMMMRMMGNYYPGYYTGFDFTLIFGVVGWILFLILLVVFSSRKSFGSRRK